MYMNLICIFAEQCCGKFDFVRSDGTFIYLGFECEGEMTLVTCRMKIIVII